LLSLTYLVAIILLLSYARKKKEQPTKTIAKILTVLVNSLILAIAIGTKLFLISKLEYTSLKPM